MQSARQSTTIDTEPQATYIVAGSNSLIETLIEGLKSRGMYVVHVMLEGGQSNADEAISPGKLLLRTSELPPDFLIIERTKKFLDWLTTKEHEDLLQKIASLPSGPKITGINWDGISETLEGEKTCFLGDIIGKDTPPTQVHEMITQALQGRIEIPGDGLSPLNPLSAADASNACLEIILNPYVTSKKIRVESPESISTLNIAYKIRSSLERKVDISFVAEKQGRPEIQGTPIYEATSFDPKVSQEEAIEETINWLKNEDVPTATVQAPSEPRKEEAGESQPQPVDGEQDEKKQEKGVKKEGSLEGKEDHRKRLSPLEAPKVEFVKSEERVTGLSKLKQKVASIKGRVRQKKEKKEKEPLEKRSYSKGKKVALALILALFFYTASLALAVAGSLWGTQELVSSLKNQELPTLAIKVAKGSATYLEMNALALRGIPGLGDSKKLDEVVSLTSAVASITAASDEASEVLKNAEDLVGHVLGSRTIDAQEKITAISSGTESVYEKLSLIDAELGQTPPSIIPDRYKEQYASLRQELSFLRQSILAAKKTSTTLPDLLGVGESRKYAILLQNNMELRPTGGFIGSFAIADLENAQLFDLQVYDVYQADGQLKGHVEPPDQIREHLGEANWYLRDSNWDPNFETSARRAEWFIDKTIKQQVDGTIAVNLYTMQNVLSAVGPIELVDYEEEITKDNLFERAEYHAEVNFFPGSTQKKEFLATLTSSLFTKIRDADKEMVARLTKGIYDSLTTRQTLISVQNDNSDAVLGQLGWNGEIESLPCPKVGGGEECLNDYIYVVDANLGVNKANYFVRRKFDITTNISRDLDVNHTIKISYVNTSTSGEWPAGNYKNYQRLYLPPGATVREIMVGGDRLDSSEIDLEASNGKTSVGYLVNVPINSAVEVEVSYALGESLSESSPTYSLYWQKQPGTANDPISVVVNYPLYLEPQTISPQAETSAQQLIFDISNSQDRRVIVAF